MEPKNAARVQEFQAPHETLHSSEIASEILRNSPFHAILATDTSHYHVTMSPNEAAEAPTGSSNFNSSSITVSPPLRPLNLHSVPNLRASSPHSFTTSSLSSPLRRDWESLICPPRFPHEGGIHSRVESRNSSAQFLIAHRRFRLVSGGGMETLSSGDPMRSESVQHHLQGKTFLGGLINPPVIRQFLHDGNLYKEEEERGLSHFELFADLVFVAIIRIFGEVAAEEATISNALKFILIFWPPWSIWADMRSYLNVSGTDDIIERAYILLSSLLLIGYTAQGASIQVVSHAAAEREYSAIVPLHLDVAFISEEGYDALHAATGFFLVAKGMRLCLLLVYAFVLPRFRWAHLIQATFTLIPCLIFFRMFFVSEVVDTMQVFAIGVGLDILGKFVAGVIVHAMVTKKNQHQFFIPALEIGHVIDKTTAFFVLVIGEILMAVTYVAREHIEVGPHAEYARSCLGVTMSFLLCWVYFDVDSCKVFVHAIRRHWFSSIAWTQLHVLLCASLVVVASAVHKTILHNSLHQGLRWYFAIGMSVAMICLGLMGFLHLSLDKPGSGITPRWIRLILRVLLGILFAVIPLYKNDSSVLELGFYCAGLGVLVISEIVGKSGTLGNMVEPTLDISNSSSANPSYLHSDGGTAMATEYSYRNKSFRSDELTGYERGESSIGADNSVGSLKTVVVRRGQRTGLAAL